MHKPHLIDGLKYDLRIYAVVVGMNPPRVYVYKDGLARFATVPYEKPHERKTPGSGLAKQMWLYPRGTIWAGIMVCTGAGENHQNGSAGIQPCEELWPIIFFIPEDVDWSQGLPWKLIVAMYCPALAWTMAVLGRPCWATSGGLTQQW